jgi:hypothetical protein
MAIRNCGNRDFDGNLLRRGCPGSFDAPDWQAYCSPECRREAHARLMTVPCSRPYTVMRNQPAPARNTTSVREGFRALADEMTGTNDDDRMTDMLVKRALSLGPCRPDLSI